MPRQAACCRQLTFIGGITSLRTAVLNQGSRLTIYPRGAAWHAGRRGFFNNVRVRAQIPQWGTPDKYVEIHANRAADHTPSRAPVGCPAVSSPRLHAPRASLLHAR